MKTKQHTGQSALEAIASQLENLGYSSPEQPEMIALSKAIRILISAHTKDLRPMLRDATGDELRRELAGLYHAVELLNAGRPAPYEPDEAELPTY